MADSAQELPRVGVTKIVDRARDFPELRESPIALVGNSTISKLGT